MIRSQHYTYDDTIVNKKGDARLRRRPHVVKIITQSQKYQHKYKSANSDWSE